MKAVKMATCDHCDRPLTAIKGQITRDKFARLYSCPNGALEFNPSEHTVRECIKGREHIWQEIWEQDGRQVVSAVIKEFVPH